MTVFFIILAVIGIIGSVATIIYALWHLLDMLADALDEHERMHRRQWDC